MPHAQLIDPAYCQGASKYARRKRKRRRRMFAEQGGRCHWCGEQMELEATRRTVFGKIKDNPRLATFEHVVPKQFGGVSATTNLVLAHAVCNRKRDVRKWPHDPVYGASTGQGAGADLKPARTATSGDRDLGAPPASEVPCEEGAEAQTVGSTGATRTCPSSEETSFSAQPTDAGSPASA